MAETENSSTPWDSSFTEVSPQAISTFEENATTYNSIDEGFDAIMRKHLGGNETDLANPNQQKQKETEKTEPTAEDMFNQLNEDNKAAEDQNKPADPNAGKDVFKEFEFKDDYGNNIKIKNQKQLDSIIQKGIYAQKVYEQGKEMEAKFTEAQEAVSKLNHLEEMIQSNPKTLVDDIMWNMSQKDAIDLLTEWSDKLMKNPEEFAGLKRQREADLALRREEQQHQMALERQQHEAALYEKQSEELAMGWMESSRASWREQLPADLHPVVDQSIEYVLNKTQIMLDQGKNVTVPQMSEMLKQSLGHVAKYIKSGAADKAVAQQVAAGGKAATQRIQQGMGNVGAAAKPAPTKPKSTDDIFRDLERGLSSGKIKIVKDL